MSVSLWPGQLGGSPTRQVRPLDAEAAARTAQAWQGSIPKAGDGQLVQAAAAP